MNILSKILTVLQENPYRRKIIIIIIICLFLSYFFPNRIEVLSDLLESYVGFIVFTPLLNVICFKLLLGLSFLSCYLNFKENITVTFSNYLPKKKSPLIKHLRKRLIETPSLNILLFFMCSASFLIPLTALEEYPLSIQEQLIFNLSLVILYYYKILSIPFYEYEKIQANFERKQFIKSSWSNNSIGFLLLRFKLTQILCYPKFDHAINQAQKAISYISKSAPTQNPYKPIKTIIRNSVEAPSSSTMDNLVEVLKSPAAAGLITAGGGLYASHLISLSNENIATMERQTKVDIAEIEKQTKENVAEIEKQTKVEVALSQERKAKTELEHEKLKSCNIS